MSFADNKILVIGGSAGSIPDVIKLLPNLLTQEMITVIVIHFPDTKDPPFIKNNNVIAIEDKTPLVKGNIYIAPGGYHSYIEPSGHFSLSFDEKINYCRPSIDVLFYSAAEIFFQQCIAVILSGANDDGALGIKYIADCGGKTFIQEPNEASVPIMPLAAIDASKESIVLNNEQIALKINAIIGNNND